MIVYRCLYTNATGEGQGVANRRGRAGGGGGFDSEGAEVLAGVAARHSQGRQAFQRSAQQRRYACVVVYVWNIKKPGISWNLMHLKKKN